MRDARVLPHDLAAEASILGGIILHNEVLDDLGDLEVDDFYHWPHRVVFEAIRTLEAAGKPIDVVTLEGEIARTGRIEAVGGEGAPLLGELALRVPTVDNVRAYRDTVKCLAANRRAIVALGSALERACKWPHDPSELISEIFGSLQRDLDCLAPKAFRDEWTEAFDRALAEVKANLSPKNDRKREPLFMVDAVDLLQRRFDGPRWLVTGLITRGGITMIGAEPKATKTWLGTELAVAVATGTKFCGEFFAEYGTVAYFYAEDREEQVQHRLRALLAGRPTTLIERGRLITQPRGKYLDIMRDEDLAWILASARRLGQLDLLVLDPLRDIHSGEEDKSDSMRDVMRRLRLLGELLSCTVAVVHHAPKASKENSRRRAGQNLRGSSAIHGAVDSGIYLTDTDGDGTNTFSNVVTSQVKGARSAGVFTIELAIVDDENGEAVKATWTVTREPRTQTSARQSAKSKAAAADDKAMFEFVRALAMRGEHLSRTALREHDERPIPEKRVCPALDRLIETGQLVLVGKTVRLPEPKQVGSQ